MTKTTMSDVIESLTGYDEIAIFSNFKAADGTPTNEINELGSLTLPRALIFIEERRTGKDDAQAYDAAMALRVKDVAERFIDDDEVEPVLPGVDPVTDAGKSEVAPALAGD